MESLRDVPAQSVKMPHLIQQDNAKISLPKLSLTEIFDAMMEKTRTDLSSNVIEITMGNVFNTSHAILWYYLPHLDSYYSPSYSIVCSQKQSIIAASFSTVAPMSMRIQNANPFFVRGLDDRVIPENYSILTIPILNRLKKTVAVIQLGRKPEKPFGKNDYPVAEWFMNKFKIYGNLIFTDLSILESSINASFVDGDENTIINAMKTLQREFGCRKAELFVYRPNKNQISRVVMNGKEVAYEDALTGVVSHSLLHTQIIMEQDVTLAPGYIPSIDGCFAESVLVFPYSETTKKTWAVCLRGRISGFRDSDIVKIKTIMPIIVRSLRIIIKKNKVPPIVDTRKQGLTALLDVAEKLSGVLDIDTLVPMIMQRSCDLLEAERCSLFLIDPQKGELVSYFHGGLANEIRIPLTSGIVGTTATTGEVQIVNDTYNDERFNPSIDKKTGFITKNILTVPIYNNKGEIAGVTELMNKLNSPDGFSEEDVKLLTGFNVFCGIALDNSRLYSASTELTKQVRSFIDVSMNLTKNISMRSICEVILQNAINISEAQGGCLFLLDTNEKITPLCGINSTMDTPFIFIRKAISEKKIVVLASQEINDILQKLRTDRKAQRAMDDNKSIRSMNSDFGTARSIAPLAQDDTICLIPLKGSDGGILGIMEVDLKSKLASENQKLLECFAVYASFSLERNHLKDIAVLGNHESELKQLISRDERQSFEGIPANLKLPQRTVAQLWTINFDSLDWDDNGYIQVVFAIFNRFQIQKHFQITNEKMFRFIVELRAQYNKVPYHNWAHAVDVLQFMSYQIILGRLEEKLTSLEIFALLIASICHDVNHDGFTNDFNEKAETPLGILFKNQSVLEMHHCEVTIDIMANDQCNLFSALELSDFKHIWNLIIKMILATDMSKHFTIMKEFNNVIETFDFENKEDRILLFEILIKVADLSNVSRPFDLADRWCAALCEEFFRQGNLEAARGMKYTSDFNDREHLNKAKSQIGFYTSVCLPLYQSITRVVPTLDVNLLQVENNLSAWRAAEKAKKISEEIKNSKEALKSEKKEKESQERAVEKCVRPKAIDVIKATARSAKKDFAKKENLRKESAKKDQPKKEPPPSN